MSAAAVQKAMSDWMSTAIEDCRRHVRDVISVCASVRTIHKIREEANRMERPERWPVILQRLHLPLDLDIYRCCYQPLFAERVKEIISALWLRTIDQARGDVAEMMAATKVVPKGKIVDSLL